MSQDFEVIEADPKDLEGISQLLKQRALHPDENLWEQYRETMLGSELQRSAGAEPKQFSLVVIDKIGIVRGFCMVRRRRHPNYPRLLDVPVIAIEKGPNENAIARTIFDHLLRFARGQHFDALLFGSSTPGCWGERAVPDGATRLGGTIMPLNINRQAHGEPSKPSNAGSPIPQLGDHSFDRSRSYRTDASCSPRQYAKASA